MTMTRDNIERARLRAVQSCIRAVQRIGDGDEDDERMSETEAIRVAISFVFHDNKISMTLHDDHVHLTTYWDFGDEEASAVYVIYTDGERFVIYDAHWGIKSFNDEKELLLHLKVIRHIDCKGC